MFDLRLDDFVGHVGGVLERTANGQAWDFDALPPFLYIHPEHVDSTNSAPQTLDFHAKITSTHGVALHRACPDVFLYRDWIDGAYRPKQARTVWRYTFPR